MRIQNKELMIQYQSKERAMADRLSQTNIEKRLFHGTEGNACEKINRFGFNRSYCGKNGEPIKPIALFLKSTPLLE